MNSSSFDRRRFLGLLGAAASLPASASLLGACATSSTSTTVPASLPGGVVTSPGSGPTRKVKLGFIALTDAAPIIMAKELGYFADRQLDVEITKQASWPALRDALLAGEIDGAHALYSMPFSVATGIGGPGTTDLKIAMILNNNGQGITLHRDYVDVGYGDLTKAKALLASSDAPEMAMTFPGGTHDLWLRYWLAACGVDSSTLKISPVPPPQMVQNMTVGNIKGYSVGEPWNAVAVAKEIGFTTLATQDLWLHHPEKALVVGARFASEQPDVLLEVMGAVLAAQRWLDDQTNRAAAADTLGLEPYVNAPAADILGRLTGVYDFGLGVGTKDFAGNQMQFFRDGQTPSPRRSYGVWALAQYERLGLLSETPNYMQLVDEIMLTDVYATAAEAAGIDVPDDDMSPFDVVLDGVTFDPKKPADEVARGVQP